MRKKLFTKSTFKMACDCPTKPYYYKNAKSYGNDSVTNEFLLALAEGGFQVGELAKCYYPGGIDITTLDYDEALSQTNELLKRENVVIFEGAIQYKNNFIRVDIIEKIGNNVNLIEVKSKSFYSEYEISPKNLEKYGNALSFGDEKVLYNDEILTNTLTSIRSEWKEYIYDVCFQYHVMNESTNYNITPYLMLADKSKTSNRNGLNQLFQIREENGRKRAEIVGDVTDLGTEILGKINVLPLFDFVYAEFSGEKLSAPPFDYGYGFSDVDFSEKITEWSNAYVSDEKIQCEVSDKCFKCQFRYRKADKGSGFKECISTMFDNVDFDKPMIDEIWNYRSKNALLNKGKLYLSQVTRNDIVKGEGTDTQLRQWMQIEKTNNGEGAYINSELLKAYDKSFTYPLHFIDFETSMVAIPFNSGRRPYEQIAFQFSHHTLDANGKVEHKGQFISVNSGEFPNFVFLRALKKDLETDNGTIFRYSPHENTVLNQIAQQLYVSDEEDKQELLDFIYTITYGYRPIVDEETGKTYLEKYVGERNMVDMLVMVKEAFWGKEMGGSNSIKGVIPAVLNNSKYIQEKYSKDIYGKGLEINSLNFEKKNWIEKDENGNVINPYKLLNSKICNGAEAMTTYTRLQFTNVSDKEKEQMRIELLRYCELDTLSMVMIYEYWLNNMMDDIEYYSFEGGVSEINIG